MKQPRRLTAAEKKWLSAANFDNSDKYGVDVELHGGIRQAGGGLRLVHRTERVSGDQPKIEVVLNPANGVYK